RRSEALPITMETSGLCAILFIVTLDPDRTLDTFRLVPCLRACRGEDRHVRHLAARPHFGLIVTVHENAVLLRARVEPDVAWAAARADGAKDVERHGRRVQLGAAETETRHCAQMLFELRSRAGLDGVMPRIMRPR